MINKIGVLVFAGLICLDGATAPRKTSTAYSLSLFVTLRAKKNLDLILHPSGFTNGSCCHKLCLKLRIFHLKSRFPQDFKVTEEQSGAGEGHIMGLMFSCCYYNAIKPVDNNGMIANDTGGRKYCTSCLTSEELHQ